MAANVETMLYTQDQPWHGLGVYLGDQDGVTTRKAIEADPKIGSDVNATPIAARLEDGTFAEIPGQYAMVRQYDKKVVGVVGEQFKASNIQPTRMFEFFDNVLGESQAKIHTAGLLNEGRKIWILAKLAGEDIRVKNTDDTVTKYLLLCGAFDGSMPILGLFTPTRVVCQNTLNGALRGEKYNQVAIRHTRFAEMRLTAAEETMRAALEFYSKFDEKIQVLASTKLMQPQIDLALRRMFGVGDNTAQDDIAARTRNNMEKVLELSEIGKGNHEWRGTAWGLINGATEFADHYMVVRGARSGDGEVKSGGESRDKILNSTWFGAAAEIKANAFTAVDSILNM